MQKGLIENIFKGVLAILMSVSLFILRDFKFSMDNMREAITDLNVQLATMSEKLVSQSYVNKILSNRIDRLERELKEK